MIVLVLIKRVIRVHALYKIVIIIYYNFIYYNILNQSFQFWIGKRNT